MSSKKTVQYSSSMYDRRSTVCNNILSLLGGKLLNSSKYIISEETASEYALRMNLTINRLKKGDFGEYSCSAINGYGRADGTVILKGKTLF